MAKIVTDTGTFSIPALPAGNIAGTVTIVSGDTDIVGLGTAFSTVFEIGDYIVVGTVLRRVVGIFDDLRMELNAAWTTAAAGTTAKFVSGQVEMAREMEIEAIGGAITISTDTTDNANITNGSPRTLKENVGLGAVLIAAGGNSAEIIYK